MMNKIKEHATLFRSAILKCDPKSLPITLQGFPGGACGDAALLLAKYLQENNLGQYNYMIGQREGRSHAWLQNNDFIVDITADQFIDQSDTVIVTKDNSWHSIFNGEALHVADINIYDENTKAMLQNAYMTIKNEIGT